MTSDVLIKLILFQMQEFSKSRCFLVHSVKQCYVINRNKIYPGQLKRDLFTGWHS